MIRRTLCGLAAIVALSGCPPEKKTPEMGSKYEPVSLTTLKGNPILYARKNVEVSGIPLGAYYGARSHMGSTLAVVIGKEGSYLLCSTDDITPELGARAMALINSEMNDGDNEPILLKGTFKADVLSLDSVTANGYTIDF